MSERDRVLAYLTGLVAVLTLSYVGGWLLGPSLGIDDPAPPAPTHRMDPTGTTGHDMEPGHDLEPGHETSER